MFKNVQQALHPTWLKLKETQAWKSFWWIRINFYEKLTQKFKSTSKWPSNVSRGAHFSLWRSNFILTLAFETLKNCIYEINLNSRFHIFPLKDHFRKLKINLRVTVPLLSPSCCYLGTSLWVSHKQFIIQILILLRHP